MSVLIVIGCIVLWLVIGAIAGGIIAAKHNDSSAFIGVIFGPLSFLWFVFTFARKQAEAAQGRREYANRAAELTELSAQDVKERLSSAYITDPDRTILERMRRAER